ncbi:MAG: hypothetical protein HC838_06035 [Spirulinaceae cyanobacterium RM2_2_10]|nr:hypothetical protein [Spirulinaceae cyanobacterium RM2_2_10]
MLRQAARVKFYRFACTSFATDGRDAWLLYRGHRCFNAIAPSDLLNAAERGGRYLRHQQSPEGRFTYCYHASRDRVTIDYNLLRHAGAAIALLDLYEVTGELEFLDAAQGGLDYLCPLAKRHPSSPPSAAALLKTALRSWGRRH